MHRGDHDTVENARIYTPPDGPIPVIVSAFGPKAIDVAAEIGEGWVTTGPDADLLGRYRSAGGAGPALGAVKVCWARTRATPASWPTRCGRPAPSGPSHAGALRVGGLAGHRGGSQQGHPLRSRPRALCCRDPRVRGGGVRRSGPDPDRSRPGGLLLLLRSGAQASPRRLMILRDPTLGPSRTRSGPASCDDAVETGVLEPGAGRPVVGEAPSERRGVGLGRRPVAAAELGRGERFGRRTALTGTRRAIAACQRALTG